MIREQDQWEKEENERVEQQKRRALEREEAEKENIHTLQTSEDKVDKHNGEVNQAYADFNIAYS